MTNALLIILLSITCGFAGAEEEAASKKTKFVELSGFFGQGFANASTTGLVVGSARVEADSTEKNRTTGGFEAEFRDPPSPFSIGVMLNFSSLGDDFKMNATEALAGVKYHHAVNDFDAWIGLSAGLAFVSLNKDQTTVAGLTATVLPAKASPDVAGRIGVDWCGFKPVFFGMHIGVHNYAYRSQVSIRNNTTGQTALYDYRVDNTWSDAVIRVGVRF